MLIVEETVTNRLLFLERVAHEGVILSVSGDRNNDEMTVYITMTEGNTCKRIAFKSVDDFQTFCKFIRIPTDMIVRLSNNGNLYTITWMESDSANLDTIYLSTNYDEENAMEIRPPLTQQFLRMLRDVSRVIDDL